MEEFAQFCKLLDEFASPWIVPRHLCNRTRELIHLLFDFFLCHTLTVFFLGAILERSGFTKSHGG